MAEALLVVSQVRMTQQDTGDEIPRTSGEMQRWIRAVLSEPDEQLAVVVLPHLIARLDNWAAVSVKEVAHE